MKNNEQRNERIFQEIEKTIPGVNREIQGELDAFKEKANDSAASLVIKIIDDDKETVLFHDEFGEPFVRLNINGHKEILRCRSKQFRRWISSTYWDKYHKPPGADAFNNALNVLEGRACFKCEEFHLYNRVTKSDDVIWYDLADTDWRAVKISVNGWEVVTNPPIMFRRYSHQSAQCIPVGGREIKEILKYVNITNTRHQLLFLVYLVSSFIPDYPHPVPNIYGGQGSAKSTVSKLLRKLIDPSKIEVASLTGDYAQLAQLVSHHWFLCFDNISYIPDAASDILCKVVSGSGFSKRELYSDDEDIIYSVRHCLALNGINLPATKPDLLERSILFELPKMLHENRKDEGKLIKEFEEDRPYILGAIFDSIAKALKIHPLLHIENLPRMADFTLWGCAIAEALGYSQQEFLDAYRANISMQNEEVLGEHIESSLLIEFMSIRDNREWVGRYSELLDEFKKLAEDQKIDGKLLPKSPNALSRKLNVLKSNLEEVGLFILNQKSGQRLVTIRKVSENIAPTANLATTQQPSNSNNSDNDSNVETIAVTSPLNSLPISTTTSDMDDMGDIFSGL